MHAHLPCSNGLRLCVVRSILLHVVNCFLPSWMTVRLPRYANATACSYCVLVSNLRCILTVRHEVSVQKSV
ncbi:hypothetical protein BC835DRAFT_1381761 [Cytidiella melzeri]|nr:hypothetical protein BC835DRAFT_1381761 [Cytidiella melzeri]